MIEALDRLVSMFGFGDTPKAPELDAQSKAYRSNTYEMFKHAQTRGDDMADVLTKFSKEQIAMTPDDYINLYNQMANNPMMQTDINRGQAQNYNRMAMGGMANSNLNAYENERIRQMVSNQYGQQNLSNYMALRGQGVDMGNQLVNYGLNAGQSTLSGIQADEQMLLQRFQADQQAAQNTPFAQLSNAALAAIGGAVAGPLGATLGSGLMGKLGYEQNLFSSGYSKKGTELPRIQKAYQTLGVLPGFGK